jgi:REP element-mobilizing transposase RayT
MPRRSPALVLVHIVWATLRRRPILSASFDAVLATILGRKASDIGCWVLAVGSASDHVHVLVRLAPSVPLADLVQRLKGASAHDVNQHRLLPEHLAWQAGYWAESFGPADAQPLIDYLRDQRVHHDDSHPAEQWPFDDQGESANGGL